MDEFIHWAELMKVSVLPLQLNQLKQLKYIKQRGINQGIRDTVQAPAIRQQDLPSTFNTSRRIVGFAFQSCEQTTLSTAEQGTAQLSLPAHLPWGLTRNPFVRKMLG